MRIKTEVVKGIFIVTLDGDRLDAPQAEEFLAAMQTFINEGNVHILLDLSHVVFMDSTGLGSIIRSLKEVYSYGQLVICGVSEQVRGLLKLTRLDEVFIIAQDREDALKGMLIFMQQAPVVEDKKAASGSGRSSGISAQSLGSLSLEDDTEDKDKTGERRVFRRLDNDEIIDTEIFAYCRDISTGRTSNGVVLDISTGGLLMLSNVTLAIGDELHVDFPIGLVFRLSENVRVKTVHDGKYGVEFMKISDDTRKFLERAVGSIRMKA